MRQTDYNLSAARLRKKRKAKTLLAAIAMRAEVPLICSALQKRKRASHDLAKIHMRSRHISCTTFNLNVYSEEDCLRDFRFRQKELPIIARLLSWTAGRIKRNRYRCNPLTACCIVLRRLAYPCLWKDLELVFGMHSSALSEVFWEVLEEFCANRGHLVSVLRTGMLQEKAEVYATALRNKDAPLDRCVGFVDCTKIQMARPGGHGSLQRAVYSGHKRFHCLIYQTLTTPHGLIFGFYGPEVGRRHDTTLLKQSGWNDLLQAHLTIDGVQYYVYGDAAYMLRPWFQTAFPRVGATVWQQEYNKRMSAIRVAVEWNYKDVKQFFTTNDFARGLKVRGAPIALMYKASLLLFNLKSCMHSGGQLQSFFALRPPTLTEYVGGTVQPLH